jgi:hypothetical protein
MMRKMLFGLAMVGMIAPSLGHAQVAIDMGRVTCADYLAMPPETSTDFSAWMSGWFSQKSGSVSVDLDAYRHNVDSVKAWCAQNKASSVMGGLQAAKIKQ